jgi:hypothetical protein
VRQAAPETAHFLSKPSAAVKARYLARRVGQAQSADPDGANLPYAPFTDGQRRWLMIGLAALLEMVDRQDKGEGLI